MVAVGRKIGFTNPVAWPGMELNTPVWGYVYRTTVFDTTAGATQHDAQALQQVCRAVVAAIIRVERNACVVKSVDGVHEIVMNQVVCARL